MARHKRGSTVQYESLTVAFTPEELQAVIERIPRGTPKATFVRESLFTHLGIDPQKVNKPAQSV